MSTKYFILEYANYPERPEILFDGNTPTKERKSLDETKFIVRCEEGDLECVSWMNEGETEYTHAEILTILDGAEWNE